MNKQATRSLTPLICSAVQRQDDDTTPREQRALSLDIRLPLRPIICFLICISCFCLQPLFLCFPALAETWVMVARSDATQEVQYVDADSIELSDAGVRLKTYWGFLDQPHAMSYATTEYRCETAEYRDAVIDGKQTDDAWKPIGDDPLNRAAMHYGCQRFASQKAATP